MSRRKALGFSQGYIAERVGITVSTWSRIESGDSALTIEQLAQAAQALSMMPGELMQAIDDITANLHEKGIRTNIARATPDKIAASGAIPLVGSGLASTIGVTGGAIAVSAVAGIRATGLATGLAVTAAGPLAVGVAVYGLYKWLKD